MFKRILTAVDGSSCASSTISHTLALAQCFKATVIGLSVVDAKLLTGSFVHDMAASVGFGDLDSYRPKVREMLVEKADVALDMAEEACRTEGVPFSRVRGEGNVVGEIVEQAKFADMLVMGKQGEHAEVNAGELGGTVESVVRRSNRPVLLAPPAYTPVRRVLAAYDGSAYAFDALRALADMAKSMDLSIRLLTVGKTVDEAAQAWVDAHGDIWKAWVP